MLLILCRIRGLVSKNINKRVQLYAYESLVIKQLVLPRFPTKYGSKDNEIKIRNEIL